MQGKAIAWIGAVVGIISAIGVLYGIFHHSDTSVANYQKQVRPTCDRVHATLTAYKPGQSQTRSWGGRSRSRCRCSRSGSPSGSSACGTPAAASTP